MKKLNKLIETLCPSGVEYKPLWLLTAWDKKFNGVEKETTEKIRKVLKEEKKKGKIIILASHIKEDIEELADVVYEIDAGKIEKIR